MEDIIERFPASPLTKAKKERWDMFLEHVGNSNNEKEEYTIMDLTDTIKSVEKRPYRSCRDSSVMENNLINSYVSYEKKSSRNSIRSSNVSKNKSQCGTKHSKEVTDIKKTVDSVVFKKPVTPKRKQIAPINKVNNDVSSSGYHTSDSRRSSITMNPPQPTVVVNHTKGFIQAVLDHNLRKANRHTITIDILQYLSLPPSSDKGHKINRKSIRAFLEKTQCTIDVNTMTMLVQLIEKVTKIKLRKFIFGMRILESLNRMDDRKYELLCKWVKQEILNIFPLLHIDAIKVYVEYVLFLYEIRRKTLF